MDLPEVEIVGPQSAQGLLKLLHRHVLAPSVRADFGHQEDLMAPAFQRFAHPFFTAPVVILPGIVHKCDAGLDRLMDDPYRFALVFCAAEMSAAQRQHGDLDAGLAERPARNLAGSWRIVRIRLSDVLDRLSDAQRAVQGDRRT